MFGFGKKKVAPARQELPQIPSVDELLQTGAYRRFDEDEAAHATGLAVAAFPEFADRISAFGQDWLGRIFATDASRDGQVLMLEPGTGEALEIPVDLAQFHEEELEDNAEAAVAWSFYREWRGHGGAMPEKGQCVGYRTPLFLNGSDTVNNLELADLDVYWTLSGQLLAKIRRA